MSDPDAPGQRGLRLQASTIRWGADAHMLISREAARVGVSFSQYVREAALVRAALQQAQYEGTLMRSAQELYEELVVGFQEAPTPTTPAELGRAIDAVLEYGPAEFNTLLRRLDDARPEQAAYLRSIYGLSPSGFADEG